MRKKRWLILLFPVVICGCNKSEVIEGGDDKFTVIEYLPGPGQFINERMDCNTSTEAVEWAQKRIDGGNYVSLGAFGGYIILKAPEAIENKEGYDFGVRGNAFDGNSEPGIVWVSVDSNGNGLPDDQWYELAGGDAVRRNYSVTYFRPAEPGNVPWEDSDEAAGFVQHLTAYHPQNYYPKWITDNSYTLTGSLLSPKTDYIDGKWKNLAYSWGYADNLGSDVHYENEIYRYNRFDLDDAVDSEGNKVKINRIHFIKIQSAVLNNVEILGETSPEVFGIEIL